MTKIVDLVPIWILGFNIDCNRVIEENCFWVVCRGYNPLQV